jgi:hypothetical protein
MQQIKELMQDGIAAAVREETTKLFSVYRHNITDPTQQERTLNGLVQINEAATGMLNLIERWAETAPLES